MALISDGLLIVTALSAGLYCLVLSRRLRRLTDSGDGIGAQIESLDRALVETRSALDDTRERVAELRGSAKVSLDELARATEAAGALAERLDQAAARADSTLQRLYRAADRVEAHDARQAPADDAADSAAVPVEIGATDFGGGAFEGVDPAAAGFEAGAQPGSDDDAELGGAEFVAAEFDDGEVEEGERHQRALGSDPGESDELELVELPAGALRPAGRAGASASAASFEAADPAADPAAAKRRRGAVLKIERMML